MPEIYYNSLKPATLTDAINSISTPIAVYKKFEGETKARALMVLILSDLVNFFNVGKRMNDVQIAQTADLILDNFYYFNIEDFKLCFNSAKSGYFGKVYDRIDGMVIMDWLKQYENERAENCFNTNYNQHLSQKANEKNAPDFMEVVTNRNKQ